MGKKQDVGAKVDEKLVKDTERMKDIAENYNDEKEEERFLKWEATVIQRLRYFILFLLLCTLIGGSAALKAPDSTIKLDKEDLKFLFGDKEAPPHSIVNIRSRSREKRSSRTLTEDPGLLDVIIEDEEEKIEFELRPNYNLVSPEFVLVVRDDDGETTERGITRPSCVFMGAAKGHPDTTAALSNCDGKGFTGVIVANNYTHLIKPLKSNSRRRRRRRRQTQEFPEEGTEEIVDVDNDSSNNDDAYDYDLTPDGLHVIHTKDRNSKCAVFNLQAMKAPRFIIKLPDNFTESDSQQTETDEYEDDIWERTNGHEGEHYLTKRGAHKRLQIETAVFVDDVMYDIIASQNPKADVVETVTDVVFAIMNGVHLLYNAPSLNIHFSITLVRLDIIKSALKGPAKANGDIQRYLSNFCFWQRNLNRKEKKSDNKQTGLWDHGLLLSGLDLWDGKPDMDSVIGLAWVAGMCHPQYSCTINEGTSFEAVYVITHEMGHNLGMSHDGSIEDKNNCDPDSYIMSSSTGPGKVTWSKCSNRELKAFLENREFSVNCLDNLQRGPRELDFSHDKLPGEMYTIGQQCTYALGSTFKPYVTSKNPYNNVCRETWCQNTTHAMRTHPALEGTSCGIKKFCVNGQCLKKPTKAIERVPTTRSSTTTTTTTTQAPKRSRGFRDFFRRIRNLFTRYLSLRGEITAHAFASKWTLSNQSSCSAACGGGWLESKVTCATSGGHVVVEDDMCDPSDKPPRKAACNTRPCIGGAQPVPPPPTSPSESSIFFPSG